MWRWNVGLFLAVHDEDGSRRSNAVEVTAIEQLLAAAPPLQQLLPLLLLPLLLLRQRLSLRGHAGERLERGLPACLQRTALR